VCERKNIFRGNLASWNLEFCSSCVVLLRNVQVPRRNYDSHLVFRDPTQLRAKKLTLLGGRLEGRSSHEPCLPCGATGQRRDRSLPRPTWLPDGRSQGGSPRVRPFHCTEVGLTPAIIPNADNSGAQFLVKNSRIETRMAVKSILLLVVLAYLEEASGHGMMLEPPNRGSLWRFDWQQPANYNDNEFFCGGVVV
jgi:hypothetical protein